MTIDAMLAAHDVAALEALASKGLVRRALRDADAGLAQITKRGDDQAMVMIDGQLVVITPAGPRPGDCPCPATGLCRHVLTAILALRRDHGAQAAGPSVRDELLAVTEADLIKFAGADLDAALQVAGAQPTLSQEGSTLAVQLPDFTEPVHFIAGRTLKDAVFKGPDTRGRLARTAALLAVWLAAGRSLPHLAAPSTDDPAGLSNAFLDQAEAALGQLALSVFRGGASAAIDRVFDLAVSARAQAAPRVTGAMRSVAAQARLAASHHVNFDPEAFLADTATLYALVQALRSAPGDPALLGVLRREYTPVEDFEFWALGAESWQTPSGARGMRLHGFDPVGKRWISAGHARMAGADPAFTPSRAYDLSLLSAGSARGLVGHSVSVTAPRLSDDHQLSPSGTGIRGASFDLADLQEGGALLTRWSDVRADLGSREATGLRSREDRHPVLLAPVRIEMLGFDDIAQSYLLRLVDGTGDGLSLTIPAQDAATAAWLTEAGGKLRGLLCLRSPQSSAASPTLTPICVLTETKRDLVITNLAFDPLPDTKSLIKAFTQRWRGAAQSVRASHDPLSATVQGVLRHLVDVLSGGSADSGRMEAQLDAAGLDLVRTALARFREDPTPVHAFRAAYLAHRVDASL